MEMRVGDYRQDAYKIQPQPSCLDCILGALASLLICLRVFASLASRVKSAVLTTQAGTEMSVGDYYQDAYKIQLQPKLPCLNVGGSGKPTYVPAELATVKRGQRKLKLDERQQAQMIREAAIKPFVSVVPVRTMFKVICNEQTTVSTAACYCPGWECTG